LRFQQFQQIVFIVFIQIGHNLALKRKMPARQNADRQGIVQAYWAAAPLSAEG
jgi:predicted GNAT superfamily acetyltransferase